MRLGGEHKLVEVKEEGVRLGEEKEEIFEGLGEDEAVHPVLVLERSNILDGRVAAGDPGVLLQGPQHLLANLQPGGGLVNTLVGQTTNLQIMRVAGGAVEEVGRLDELRAQQVLSPVHLQLCSGIV